MMNKSMKNKQWIKIHIVTNVNCICVLNNSIRDSDRYILYRYNYKT